ENNTKTENTVSLEPCQDQLSATSCSLGPPPGGPRERRGAPARPLSCVAPPPPRRAGRGEPQGGAGADLECLVRACELLPPAAAAPRGAAGGQAGAGGLGARRQEAARCVLEASTQPDVLEAVARHFLGRWRGQRQAQVTVSPSAAPVQAEALAAWQKFYDAQQQEGACPLPAPGFDCEQGHECTFKDAKLQTFKVLNHGGLTETVLSNGGAAYFFGENSPSVPPYYLAKLQCNGEVLLKAPAAESGDKVDKESCSTYKAMQSVTVGNNTWKSSVERLIRSNYLCIDVNVSSASAAGWEGVCLLSKSPLSSDPPSINAVAKTLHVTGTELFQIVQGNFTALRGKLNTSSCPGGAPIFALAQLDGALARKGGGGGGGSSKSSGTGLMVIGAVLMVSAFVVTGASGGAFAPVATIMFGWGAGFVIGGATTVWGGGQQSAGGGVAVQAAVNAAGGKASGPAGAAVTGFAIGVGAVAGMLEGIPLHDHRGQDGDKFLKSRQDHLCADYQDGIMNAYMRPCAGNATAEWFFAEKAWLDYNNDPLRELTGRDTTPLKHMQKYQQTLPWAKEQCASSAQCQAFCWNPDDLTIFHQQTEQGFTPTGRIGQGMSCFKKVFFEGKALVSMRGTKCLEHNTGNNNVYMHHCHGGANQQWYLDGEQMKTKWDDKCLDYSFDDPSKNLYMKPCHGGLNQKWYFA
ncbi:unnamed protein product, partial [Prorocentrum cordatum]